jgi:uncharacterized protein YecE (DUF72 family)
LARRRGSLTAKTRPAPPLPDPERLGRATELASEAPLPARVERLRCGTAGWTDRTLLQSGAFYPPGAKTPEGRLRHYAAHFALVEVDATYYSLLPRSLAERWLTWTPEDFRFDVKAFPSFTGHPVDVRKLPADLREACLELGHGARAYADRLPAELRREIDARFMDLLAPLVEARRLGAVLLQFPPWFTATRANARRIETLRQDFPSLPFAVEFRHESWLLPERRERAFDLLRSVAMSYVVVDEPRLPAVFAVTEPSLAVVRFHGHNRSGWAKKGASVIERFDYLYEPDELSAWVAPVRKLGGEAREVHAVFNNCVRNYAVLGAKDLAALVASDAR